MVVDVAMDDDEPPTITGADTGVQPAEKHCQLGSGACLQPVRSFTRGSHRDKRFGYILVDPGNRTNHLAQAYLEDFSNTQIPSILLIFSSV